ncbi:pilus assembly protein [Sphingomonas sp. CGMCC 1.13654]|uniref:Pilus assembly protein n=1 Tax=Sphingomonas chungangi TaxID=2683589 RepID=A0A838LA39_9SPHN|nr:TadE/TadG family type IV pilus assembly protein [Sphingomonas chungangi]MBA2935897.1 pilus assembly protein [Sphingomonas chungangi]MVW54588.1 pilus assembly protein [Sphingomonas chungangi]
MRRLASDARGVTIVEFALVAPVMLLMIMGLGELAYDAYVQVVLTGAMQKAGRDSTIQGASAIASTIDATVMSQVNAAAPRATGASSRKSYATFGYIDPEPFTDTNGDGIREKGECFTDINGNGIWDADPGISGQGGAGDAVVYTMTITYPRLFPLYRWLGWGANATTSATTILKNQPYASQTASTPATICT